MYQLYWCPGTCSMAPMAILDEVGVESEQWKVVDDALRDRNFLVGDGCTAADIYMHMVSTWDKDPRALAARWPNMTRVAATIARRPSVARAMSKHERLAA